ncbi:gluconokinase [Sphingomonas sanguinis]|nr:gluconokinase [Sphingomonas sanguinis]
MKAKDGTGARAHGIVVMGVSGTGKTTLSERLGARLDCPVLEGDAFHSAENVAKMRTGHALTDADRWPWLDRLGAAIGEAAREGGTAIAACSALRRVYRERLRTAAGVPLYFVFLDTDTQEIARRMSGRKDHYMPPSLLDSQLATLERPTADECALTLDAGLPPEMLVAHTLGWIEQR